MLKNLLKVGVLAGVMALTCSAFAQDNAKKYAPEYPQYGFWSNWSLGAELGWAHQFGSGLDWVHGSNAGWMLMVEKELNYCWDLRFAGGVPGQWAHPSVNENGNTYTCPNEHDAYDRYAKTTAGFKFSINKAIEGYNPDRKGNFYALVDGGVAWKYDRFGWAALVADLGLGYSRQICEHSSIFVEATLDNVADINNPLRIFDGEKSYFNSFIGVGYMYNFGPTAADLELIAQRAKVTQENVDALNDQINRLNQEIANGKQAEQRLQNAINDLEERLARAPKASNGNADSLQGIINQIKDDQLTFYALPFSILYGVDEWKVADSQMDKVKAIARVMKDNENVKFNIVGFCDKTGSDAYNMKLSQKRAEEVKRILVNKYGIAEDRLSCDWKGKSMAFGDIEYSINRRTSVYRVIE